MRIRKHVIFFLVITFCIYPSIGTIQAETPFVTDCMQNGVDCTDETEKTNIKELERKDDQAGESTFFHLVKMFFALLLILALIYLLLKFLHKRNKIYSQVKALENVGGISVGPNKSIQIVRIGSSVYMIGVGENVEMLQEITDENIKTELLRKQNDPEFQAGHMFKTLFNKKSTDDNISSDETNTKFKKTFSTELEKLKQNRLKIRNQYQQKEDQHD